MEDLPLGEEFVEHWMARALGSEKMSQEVAEAIQDSRDGAELDEDALQSSLLELAEARGEDDATD